MNQHQRAEKGHDAPIETREQDLLDGYRVAQAMHRVLATAPANWSTRVALYGSWGSGKTSILNMLRTIEEQRGAWVLSFSAWSVLGEDGVITQFYEAFAKRLKEEGRTPPPRQRIKAALRLLRRHLNVFWPGVRVAAVELSPVPAAITRTAADTLSRLAGNATAWAKPGRSDLEAITKVLARRRVVVFIDDLDRADPKVIPKTLLALRELLDWPGLSFVVALDRRAIAAALSDYSTAFGEDAQGFLDKVVDVPFSVPEPDVQTRGRFAEAVMRECCENLPLDVVHSIAPFLPPQPRRVKLIARLLGALRPALQRHGPHELDWTGLCLYVVVREASTQVADWVVATCSEEAGTNWLLWVGDEEERKQREAAARQHVLELIAKPVPPSEAERIVSTTLKLLVHWELTPSDRVVYWVGLAYREPPITDQEFVQFRNAYHQDGGRDLIDSLVSRAAALAGISPQEAATACLAMALEGYQKALSAMADSSTSIEFVNQLEIAQSSLRTLEHLWNHDANASVRWAKAEYSTVSHLLAIAEKWLGWNKNDGEADLRQRERELAIRAAASCKDPEKLFADTDPFWNSDHAIGRDEGKLLKEWRTTIRQLLTPSIASRFCEKLRKRDGMVPIAAGEDKLGAWIVECKRSPLYADPTFAAQFLGEIQSAGDGADFVRENLANNCLLFLRQILRQTRSASWGGIEGGKEICLQHPEIISVAWAAVISVRVPFRMRSSVRKTRSELEDLGLSPDLLPEPAWLTAEA